MSVVNQKEFLKKYLSIGKDKKEKKKKKRAKLNPAQNRLTIIDDNIFDNIKEEIFEVEDEDAPQIVAIIDDRPPSMQVDESIMNFFKPIGNNDENSTVSSSSSFKKTDDVRDSSPKRTRVKLNLKRNASPSSKQDSNTKNLDRKSVDEQVVVKTEIMSPRADDNDPIHPIQLDKRKSSRRSSEDFSPPRKRMYDEKVIFKKEKIDDDFSPPRRRTEVMSKKLQKDDDDFSPPRRKTKISSPKMSQKDDDDFSPPRRNTKVSSLKMSQKDDDFSPPRRRTKVASPKKSQKSDDDVSPPRKRREVTPLKMSQRKKSSRWESANDDESSSKKNTDRKREEKKDRKYTDEDNSPPRKRSKTTPQKMMKTLDGKTAGLQNAKQLAKETSLLKEKEAEIFSKMAKDMSGANASTIIRDKKTGRVRNLEEEAARELQKKQKEDANKEKYSRWGRGLKQVEDATKKREDMLNEMSKPLARYADDDDLERYLKEQEREGDPMLAYIRKKKKKQDVEQGKPMKPEYMGEFMPNRFGISPGHRWDGVDRSNGYEKKWLDKQNSKLAQEEEAYKWSTEDM